MNPEPCERCGQPGLRLGERILCQGCYSICNSCCPEFGEYDLWAGILPPEGSAGRLHRPRDGASAAE